MDETQDQVQDSTETIAPGEDQQASEEQSETTEEPVESNLYELPDGRKLAGDALREEYLKLNSEFTKRSQRLAEIERQNQETEARNKREAEQSVDQSLSQNELLQNVDPTVKSAIIGIVKPEIIKEVNAYKEQLAQEASNKKAIEDFDKAFADLEKEVKEKMPWMPKPDKMFIARKIAEPGNDIYNVRWAYITGNFDTYTDGLIKAAMKGKSSGVTTESTSTEAPKKPGETTTPKSWSEASKRAISRL